MDNQQLEKCEFCGVNNKSVHPIYCESHIQCEFCGIVETLPSNIHYNGCPKWVTEYNQRRISKMRESIFSNKFNLQKFISSNFSPIKSSVTFPNIKHIRKKTNMDCPICLKENANVKTKCGHFYHETCLKEWMRLHVSCPYCKSTNFY